MSIEQILRQLAEKPDSLPYPLWESAFLSPKTISFSEEVRKACEANLCGMYGKCWTCPPGVGHWQALQEQFQQYEHAFVFTTKHILEDSFDLEGMNEGRRAHTRTEHAIEIILRQQLQNDTFAICGAEGCHLCSACTYPDAPCRHPEAAHPSMEATGMDVVRLAADTGIHYINGTNTVTYFSILFW